MSIWTQRFGFRRDCVSTYVRRLVAHQNSKVKTMMTRHRQTHVTAVYRVVEKSGTLFKYVNIHNHREEINFLHNNTTCLHQKPQAA